MAERKSEFRRGNKILRALRVVGAAGLVLSPFVVAGCANTSRDIDPKSVGFSRNADDYPYQITIDTGNGDNAYAYTMDRPVVTSGQGDQFFLTANNVLCPDWTNWQNENLGCHDFAPGEYTLASPKRIIVSTNPVYFKTHPQLEQK